MPPILKCPCPCVSPCDDESKVLPGPDIAIRKVVLNQGARPSADSFHILQHGDM